MEDFGLAPSQTTAESACLVVRWMGGNCPVQSEGTVEGREFYFRSRGSRWSFGVGQDPVGSPDWYYEEPYGEGPYDAGWMHEDEALVFLAKAAALYRSTLSVCARPQEKPGTARDTTS